ncbi:hypothetical protein MTR_0297s0010 [Medicago truncatula]|uniref:Uncharacterized protein n=1 Tax=Medicago truncatula TaxID=3880 RepID=A0A072TF16_MEDTR|nr:hypothetical protein MTR_0297s0010 [Medicago truncatula]
MPLRIRAPKVKVRDSHSREQSTATYSRSPASYSYEEQHFQAGKGLLAVAIRHGHAVLQSYFIKRPKDISPVYEEGQIPSRTLMPLSMIHQVPINQRYGYPFTYNVRMATKYLSPHLGIRVVSGLRVIYTIIIVRISYDNFITYYVVFSRWVDKIKPQVHGLIEVV